MGQFDNEYAQNNGVATLALPRQKSYFHLIEIIVDVDRFVLLTS